VRLTCDQKLVKASLIYRRDERCGDEKNHSKNTDRQFSRTGEYRSIVDTADKHGNCCLFFEHVHTRVCFFTTAETFCRGEE